MGKNAIVISASSDIALAVSTDWCSNGWNVYGTYRNSSPSLEKVKSYQNLHLVHCDLLDNLSIEKACDFLLKACPRWDVLLFAPSRQEPVGSFHKVDFNEWEEGVQLNLLQPLRVLHRLLPSRNPNPEIPEPCVLFFSGGGTNNAVVHYSSYTLSKIALIKMTELLDAELPEVRFVTIGPGWVKTKSHLPTLRLGPQWAGDNYQKTIEKLNGNECTPMQKIIDCCNWAIFTSSKGVKGRNFSVVFDSWGKIALEKELEQDPNMYKLRRGKNSWQPEKSCSSNLNGSVK